MEAVAVPARVDAGNVLEVLASLKQAAGQAGAQPLALDLAALKQFDSSALSLLLQLVRGRPEDVEPGAAPAADLSAAHRGIILLNPPPKLRELAELYGIETMLFGAGAATDEVAEPN